jgi:DNA-binding SARP family transcriptional activator
VHARAASIVETWLATRDLCHSLVGPRADRYLGGRSGTHWYPVAFAAKTFGCAISNYQASMRRPSTEGLESFRPSRGRIAVCCLGAASIRIMRGGEYESAVGPGKPLALAAYLAMAPDRRARRNHLVELLWGELEPASARHQLRNALFYLRGRLGDDFVLADDSFCALSPEAGLDVADFLDAIRRGQFEQALGSYAGAFLEGFASPGCREFEGWADIERAHLRSLALNAGESLCRGHLDAGRLSHARQAAARMVAIDPNAEVGRRLMLESVVASGDRLSAQVEAERLENWLREQERLPEAGTAVAIRLARDLTRAQDRNEGCRSSLVGELVGRESQFSELLAAWSGVGLGQAQFISVTGAAGIGKTRLLDDFARRLRTLRRRVVFVRAYAAEREVPFAFAAAFVHGLAQLPGAIAISKSAIPTLLDLNPRLQDQFPSEQLSHRPPRIDSATIVAVGELLAAVSDESPIAIVLDDAHWLDAESRSLLGAAIPRLESSPILIVSAARHPSSQLPLPPAAREIEVAPLRPADIHALISSIAVLPEYEVWPNELVQLLARASDGIPLEVLASLDRLVASGALVISDGTWKCSQVGRINLNDAAGGEAVSRLSETARRLAVGIAAVGLPVPRDALAQIAGGEAIATRELAALENAGFVWTSETSVQIAHDLIAERTLRGASAKERAEAEIAMGRALILRSERRLVERGIRLVVNDGDLDAASEAVADLVRARLKSMAPASTIAATLGRSVHEEIVQQLVRRLPIALRWRTQLRIAAGVAGFLVLSGTAIGALHARRTDRPAVLEIYEQLPGRERRGALLSLHPTDWFPEQPIRLRLGDARTDTLPKPRYGSDVLPGQERWAVEWNFGDRGGVDIRLDGPVGPIRRLTDSPADDTPVSWSPDGHYLAIETSRFDSLAHKRIGILDLATGQVRELTHDRLVQERPNWSHDGTRIAYTTHDFNSSLVDVCVTSVFGTGPTCWPQPTRAILIGWIGDQRLLLAEADSLTVLDLDTERATVVSGPVVSTQLAPNGDWIAYTKASVPGAVFVASATHPDVARRIIVDIGERRAVDMVWRREPAAEYLDTVAIVPSVDAVSLGVDYQLRAEGRTNEGASVAVRAPIWSSLTRDVATVDSAGLLTPHKPGVARISLSAGGWRTTSRSIVVVAARVPRVVLDEPWDSAFASRWHRFGQPLPRVLEHSEIGRAFLNNGDGDFFSGVYSSTAFNARDGLVIDAIVRTPITRSQWQMLILGFSRLDARAMSGWDHVTGYIPSDGTGLGCLIEYPRGEGGEALKEIGPPGDVGSHLARLRAMAKGLPTPVRVQVFPDGRCGIALDGTPIWVSPGAISNADSLNAVIEGNSVGTRILVGRVRISSGVSSDVDWRGCRGVCSPRAAK